MLEFDFVFPHNYAVEELGELPGTGTSRKGRTGRPNHASSWHRGGAQAQESEWARPYEGEVKHALAMNLSCDWVSFQIVECPPGEDFVIIAPANHRHCHHSTRRPRILC